jgi:hypothetical protein
MSAPLALAIILAVAVPAQLVRAYRLDERFVERWARDRGVALTPESRPPVARYLRNARVLRAWGAAAGVIVPTLVALVAHGRLEVLGFGTDGDSAPLAFGAIFIGYLIGALCAEVAVARPAPGARRAAGLARRELRAYLPGRTLVAQRAAAVAGALGALAAGLVALAVALAVFGAGLEALERWLVRRPQPFTGADAVAVDDAIRAQSIQVLAGAGLALLLLFCGAVAVALDVVPVAAACLVLSLLACRDVGDGSWRVARATRGPASA